MDKYFNGKEMLILNKYRHIFNEFKFDECDVLGFLIFIRSYIKSKDNSFRYILEFCDLVAHRDRNRGVVMDAIENAIKNNYEINADGSVKGYYGIHCEQWKEQWSGLLKSLDFINNDKIIREITLCIYSLAQNTMYHSKKLKTEGEIALCQSDKGKLNLITTEGSHVYICFAQYDGYEFKYKYELCGYINEDVITYREDGILHLRSKNNIII